MLSFVHLVKFVFAKIPGVKVLLSNRICQDPIEKFFGQQRQRGRAHDNPNVKDFLKSTQALRVINGVCRTVRGNCRASTSGAIVNAENEEPLPKRRKKWQ